ncbi:MAG: recombinase family protein [Pirellulales bacterium]
MSGVRAKFGLGRCTVLKLVNEGHIRAFRHGSSGWWLYSADSISEYLGIDDSDLEKKKKDVVSKSLAIYARRSDTGTKATESLESQVKLLLDYVKKTYGINESDVIIYKENVSGVNLSLKTRKAFGRLLADIFDGRISTLVVKDNSRSCRLPGSDELIQFICDRCGVEYIRMFQEGDEENDSETTHDLSVLLDYLTSWTNKKSAKKSAYLKKVHLDQNDSDKLLYWWNSGISILKIIDRCQEEGIVGRKHDGSPVQFTPTNKSTLFRLLSRLNKTTNRKGNTTHSELVASLTKFSTTYLKKKKGSNERTELVYNAYKSYCCENKIPLPTSRRTVTSTLITMGWLSKKVWQGKNKKVKYYCFQDCELLAPE